MSTQKSQKIDRASHFMDMTWT